MAMTGARRMTTALGLVRETPPDAVLDRIGTGTHLHMTSRARTSASELAHWGYGAAGAVTFGSLPPALRGSRLAGPVFGLGVWLVFETVIARVFRLQRTGGRRERAALAADHILYGLLIARPRPATDSGGDPVDRAAQTR
jgi:hypothetical protein